MRAGVLHRGAPWDTWSQLAITRHWEGLVPPTSAGMLLVRLWVTGQAEKFLGGSKVRPGGRLRLGRPRSRSQWVPAAGVKACDVQVGWGGATQGKHQCSAGNSAIVVQQQLGGRCMRASNTHCVCVCVQGSSSCRNVQVQHMQAYAYAESVCLARL